MRFLHTADLHLNALRTRFERYAERANKMLSEIDRIAVEKEVDFILVAGDIFDRRDLTNQDRQILSDWLGRTPKPVVMISGNHDARSNTIGDTCLSYLSVLSFERHIIHDGDPIIHTFYCGNEGVSLFLIPWHGWPHHEFFGIITAMLDKIAEQNTLPIIVVAHEAFAGSVADNGQPVLKSGQPKIPKLPVTYWALGDIHLQQQLADNAYYSGAPHQIDFGEKNKKGCLIVDTEAPIPEFVAISSFDLVTVTEIPALWPPFCRYMPEIHNNIALPQGVEYVAPTGIMQNEAVKAEFVDVFDGIEVVLGKTALPDHLYARAIELAKQMLAEV